MRLNRYLALGGLGSRRGVEELIVTGQVSINGEVCLDLARQVKPGDVVRVGRKTVEAKEIITIALNKPTGYVTTRDDEFGRDTVYRLLPGRLHHLRHVGRLDAESEGLLLLSNDGDLARKLTAPAVRIGKEYLVTLDQPPTNEQLETFRKGVFLPEGKAWAEEVHRVSPRRILMVLHQGLKRQIRMMTAALGLRVKRLVRIRIGGLTLNNLGLPPGKWTQLKPEELEALLTAPTPSKPENPRKVRPSRTKTSEPQGKRAHSAAEKPSKGRERPGKPTKRGRSASGSAGTDDRGSRRNTKARTGPPRSGPSKRPRRG